MPTIERRMPCFSGTSFDNGRYMLSRQIGVGGFGVVYQCRERIPGTTRSVTRAVKVCPAFPEGSNRGYCQDREAALHRKVSDHPNVASLHRVVREGRFQYTVMDYYSAGDLRTLIGKRRALARNDDLLREIILQIIDAVEACHQRGVYHRDIKPDNILVKEDLSKVYLTDFGLATNSKTSTSFGIGTPFYECPECIDCGDVEYPYDTRRADIWALGITIIQLATGRLPWSKATIHDRHFYKFLDQPDFLLKIFPITPGLNHILRRILTMIPKDQCSLSELRRLVRNLDRFWLTEKEVASSRYWAVKQTWRQYKPVESYLSEESGDSSDDWESSCGDTLESDTSSESGGSIAGASSDSERELRARRVSSGAIQKAEEGHHASPQTPPKAEGQPQPQPVEHFDNEPLPPVPAIMRTASSDEFPIRKPGCNPAVIPESTSTSSSECSGPDTPPTRPHDPPAIVTTQELSDEIPLQAVGHAENDKMTEARRASLVLWVPFSGQAAS
ncbi:kinase-like protein [Dichomitus squalens]|uniref:non-specific serine/threonine protein kinase n=1 Tax=Dichomitus squalens TaxID=114155 RepID=A0A4Q9P843_9APHY|nr:kinase-like protein [Dichomitus squalens]TBU48921.1 kinase-like protein [Dichomitus squalens]TBU59315.1 kinase-like protein [Dichomitus squalens]